MNVRSAKLNALEQWVYHTFPFLIEEDAHVIQAGIQWGAGDRSATRMHVPSFKLRHPLKVKQWLEFAFHSPSCLPWQIGHIIENFRTSVSRCEDALESQKFITF